MHFFHGDMLSVMPYTLGRRLVTIRFPREEVVQHVRLAHYSPIRAAMTPHVHGKALSICTGRPERMKGSSAENTSLTSVLELGGSVGERRRM